MRTLTVGWKYFDELCSALVKRIPPSTKAVFGVPTGGCFVAMRVAQQTGLPFLEQLAVANGVLAVDDLVDSGKTLAMYRGAGCMVDALIRKPHSPQELAPDAKVMDGWIKFPWEHATAPEDAVTRLIEYIGDDPTREGLLETPKRVVKSYTELYGGYRVDPSTVLKVFEDDSCDEMVVVRDIEFFSTCEHHMLPFFGKAHIAYVPDGRVVGVSKLVRLLEVFSRRLQIQERLCEQVTAALDTYLSPKGSACVLEAKHLCMTCRGVNKQNSVMVTSSLTGIFREATNLARQEFLSVLR